VPVTVIKTPAGAFVLLHVPFPVAPNVALHSVVVPVVKSTVPVGVPELEATVAE
jgi:hypothetical protein